MGCVVGVSSNLEQHRSPPSSSPEHHLSRVLCMVVGSHCGVSDGSIRAIECAAFGWFPSWLAAGVGDHQKQVPRLLTLLVADQYSHDQEEGCYMFVTPGRASGRRSDTLRDTLLSLFQSHQL